MKSAISLAASLVGGQAELARLLGVSSQAVNQWMMGTRPVPVKRCVDIERATNGVVTRKDLRPDNWQRIWPELTTVKRTGRPRRATPESGRAA